MVNPFVTEETLSFPFCVGRNPFFSPMSFFPLCLYLHREHFTSDASGHQMCGGFSPPSNCLGHQLGALKFNASLTPPAWRWHAVTWVKGSAPQDCSSCHFRFQEQARVAAYASDRCRWGVPVPPHLIC